jgi:ABC-type multidrug transport system fused ATPase/permease subunit
MNGGINAIRGYLFQYLICILDSFQSNWSSVIIEPTDAEEKVDILWLFKEDEKILKRAIQVKSTENTFNKGAIEKIAIDLKKSFNDADHYELVLIGHVTAPLLEYIKEDDKNGVEIPYPKVFDLNAFKGQACHMIDQYLDENYDTQLPWKHLEIFVCSLIGELQFYTTNKQEVTRDEFENKLRYWVKLHANSIDYELRENQNFKSLYGFEAPPRLRTAISSFYKQSRKIRRHSLKRGEIFLDVDQSNALKVVYPILEIVFFRGWLIFLLVAFILMIIFLCISVYYSWVFLFLVLIFILLIFMVILPPMMPYFAAKQIEKELEELKEPSRTKYKR